MISWSCPRPRRLRPRRPSWLRLPWWLWFGGRISSYDSADRAIIFHGVLFMSSIASACGCGMTVLVAGIHASAMADAMLLCTSVLAVTTGLFTLVSWMHRQRLDNEWKQEAGRHLRQPYRWHQ